MRLRTSRVADSPGSHCTQVLHRPVKEVWVSIAENVSGRSICGSGTIGGIRDMNMLRHFRNSHRMRLLAAFLAQDKALTEMNRHLATEVRQREIDAPVAAIGSAEQGEQRLVLVDRQQLAVAKCPPLGGEVERHDPEF